MYTLSVCGCVALASVKVVVTCTHCHVLVVPCVTRALLFAADGRAPSKPTAMRVAFVFGESISTQIV